jgi:hypothetical protein
MDPLSRQVFAEVRDSAEIMLDQPPVAYVDETIEVGRVHFCYNVVVISKGVT